MTVNAQVVLAVKTESEASKKSACQKSFDLFRYALSTVVTLGSLALIFFAISQGYAALPGPSYALIPLFIAVLVLLAYLEGLQVAILALERTDPEILRPHKQAFINHALATKHDGLNVQRFLVGRQFFVVFVVFLCAQITTYPGLPPGVLPEWVFFLIIKTGLPGALVVLAFGQLMPQLLAATHPIHFMNLPGSWMVLQLCLGFESIGITHFSWVLSHSVKCAFKLEDEEFTGLPEAEALVERTRIKRTSFSIGSLHSRYQPAKLLLGVGVANMSVPILDEATLRVASQIGQTALTPQTDELLQWIKKESTMLQDWGLKGRTLPSPSDIVNSLVAQGKSVPRYLLPPHHADHIPPHIVAFELLDRDQKNREQIAEMKERLSIKALNTIKVPWYKQV